MEATCADCGREFSAPFDLQRFFFGELRLTGDFLYREVHYLAYHYHWSEREIMAMTSRPPPALHRRACRRDRTTE